MAKRSSLTGVATGYIAAVLSADVGTDRSLLDRVSLRFDETADRFADEIEVELLGATVIIDITQKEDSNDNTDS